MKPLGCRQAALYGAEALALAGVGMRWLTVTQAQSYASALVESEWFSTRWPYLVRCTVERRGRGARWSTCRGLDGDGPGGLATEGVVLLAPGALDQPTLLHELAHLLTSPPGGHDVRFAETFLALVRREMGFYAYADLRRALRSTEMFGSVEDYTLAG